MAVVADQRLCASQVTLRREGVRGLYKGLLPNVLRVMPQSAITFLVYEKVMQLLESDVRWPFRD